MTKHHRFTGRELTTLLEQVRAELGAEATIVEANKVRTGGIAGFFANEKFEVIATESDDAPGDQVGLQLDLVEPTIAPGPALDLVASADERDTLDIRSAADIRSGAEIAATTGAATRSNSTAHPNSTASALLDRVETISIGDRIGLSRPPASSSVATVKAPPQPEARFGDILATELEQPELEIRTADTDDFWTHLVELEAELEPLDLQSPVVVIVGNRAAAMRIADQVALTDDGETRALVALSPAPDGFDLPAWQQVADTIELGDRLRFWSTAERQGIVMIDADFGADATTIVERAREGGARLVRMAVETTLSPKRIFDLMTRLGGNVVIDLTFRAEPAYILSLVDRGVPVASIDGHPFDANLLLALHRQVQHG